jgi:hypothetical protein
MPSRNTLAARPRPAAGPGVQTYARSTPMPSTPGAGQIVGGPTPNQRAFGVAPVAGQGYGASRNNMPVGIVNGNQTYNYGAQGGYGGYGGTYLAPPGGTTAFSGRTAATALTSGGSDHQVGSNAPRAVSTVRGSNQLGGVAGYGGVGSGGLFGGGNTAGGLFGGGANGAAIGQGLSDAWKQANDANNARYQEAKDENTSGYGGIYNTINAGKAEQMALASGLGGVQKTLNNQNTAKRLGQSHNQLVGSGLGNSTVVGSMARGINQDGDLMNQAVDEQNARLRLGVLENSQNQMVNAQTGAVGQRVGIISSKTDQGPDPSLYLNLLGRAGASGGAGAAGTGGYGGGGYGGGGSGFGGTGNGFSLNRPGDGGGYDSSNVNDASYGYGGQPQRMPAPQMPEQFYGHDGNTSGLNIPFAGASAGGGGGSQQQGQPALEPIDPYESPLGGAASPVGYGGVNNSGQAGALSADDVRRTAAQYGIDLSRYPDSQVMAMASLYGLS